MYEDITKIRWKKCPPHPAFQGHPRSSELTVTWITWVLTTYY